MAGDLVWLEPGCRVSAQNSPTSLIYPIDRNFFRTRELVRLNEHGAETALDRIIVSCQAWTHLIDEQKEVTKAWVRTRRCRHGGSLGRKPWVNGILAIRAALTRNSDRNWRLPPALLVATAPTLQLRGDGRAVISVTWQRIGGWCLPEPAVPLTNQSLAARANMSNMDGSLCGTTEIADVRQP
jgi:hypothetical protein